MICEQLSSILDEREMRKWKGSTLQLYGRQFKFYINFFVAFDVETEYNSQLIDLTYFLFLIQDSVIGTYLSSSVSPSNERQSGFFSVFFTTVVQDR